MAIVNSLFFTKLVMAKVLARRNSRMVALASLNPDYPTREFKPSEIAWIARILWASQ